MLRIFVCGEPIFTGQNNKLLTDDLDTEWFMYTGSNIETTREFCQHLTEKKYIHRSEIPTILTGKIDDHQCAIYDKTGLPYGMIEGTTPENFQVNCGGWNCRHQLVPVADAVVPADVRRRFEQIRHKVIKNTTEEAKKESLTNPTLHKLNVDFDKQNIKKELTQEEINERKELTHKRRETIDEIPQERKTKKINGEQFYTKHIVCTKKDIKNIIKHCKNEDEFKIALSIDKYLSTLSNGEREELIEKDNTENKRKRGVKYYTKYTFAADDGNRYMLKCEAIKSDSDRIIKEHPYFLKKV